MLISVSWGWGRHKRRKHMQCICSHTNCIEIEGKLTKKEKTTASGKLAEDNKLYFLMITSRTEEEKEVQAEGRGENYGMEMLKQGQGHGDGQ